MCGIVGTILYEGTVLDGLVEGLRMLEYRGYDSAGVAVVQPSGVEIRRKSGRLAELEAVLGSNGLGESTAGIGHTRWATHGPPNDRNAHPHTDDSGELAVVHNGIIENYLELREELAAEGVEFRSDTDTEIFAWLVGRELRAGCCLADAVRRVLPRVTGYYAVAFLRAPGPGQRAGNGSEPVAELVAARNGPPLAIAVGEGAAWLASDVLALVGHSRDIVFLEDGDVAEMRPGEVIVTDVAGQTLERPARHVDWDAESAGKGVHAHYMLKEIHEQPDVVARAAQERMLFDAGDAHFEEPGWGDADLAGIERIQIVACGTALYAGHVARYLIEGLARIPVDVDFASEFRYREPLLAPNTLALAISQSGETADTLAALRLARRLGARASAVCNVPGSTMVRESDAVLLTRAGPEIGVASTKAFMAQVVMAYLLALRLGRARGTIDHETGCRLADELRGLRSRMDLLLSERFVAEVRSLARAHLGQKGFLFLGRGVNFPVALEGALKLKEISYVHAEGYPAGEMKHGPIALIEPGMTIVAINSKGTVAEKVRSNIEQVKARGGQVICVGSDAQSLTLADQALEVPETLEWLSPALNVVPLQLFAYHVAELRGCDIDKPRNLAKSVTVE